MRATEASISKTRCFGVCSSMANLLGGGLRKLGPDVLPVVGTKVSAGDGPLGRALYAHAMRGIGLCSTRAPVADNGLSYAKGGRKLADAAKKCDGLIKGIHAQHHHSSDQKYQHHCYSQW